MVLNSADKKQLVPLIMAAFISPFMGSAMNLSVPAISSEFSAGAVSMGWIITSYLLTSTALMVPIGRFADIHSKKKVFVAGTVLFTVFSAMCAFSTSIGMLIFFRLCQGTGGGMLFSTNSAIIAENFPAEIRGRLMGFSVMFTYLGLTLGPVIGGVLNHILGWRSVMAITAVYSIPMIAVAVMFIQDNGHVAADSDSASADITGCVLYAAASAAFLYGLTDFTTYDYAKVIFFCSLVLLALFVLRELKAQSPMLDLRIFTESRGFTLSNVAALLNYGASFSISYMMSIYLQSVRGMNSSVAGIILITTPLVQAAFSPLAGRLSDRHSPYVLASIGMSLTCAGIVMLIFTRADTPMPYMLTAFAVNGLGFAFFSSPNSNAIMSSVKPNRYGVASSVMSTSRTVGQTASMAVVTMIVGAVVGNIALADAGTSSIMSAIHITFTVCAVLSGIGIVCSASR